MNAGQFSTIIILPFFCSLVFVGLQMFIEEHNLYISILKQKMLGVLEVLGLNFKVQVRGRNE